MGTARTLQRLKQDRAGLAGLGIVLLFFLKEEM